ncbi:bifunctional adenosylcobinamide kinase/adenosylcobinamide-phosphate guanylyltransferase [Halobacillus sp. Marseille-P3879]|uniref:bifunctional adenosylcobinamide kinase/adenosylcobinamide-phosphate guanylyltransferase n=1 Tax=Halobacillus sp. Marseille-P3879 TaxID=2045014 RepID=UPI00135C2341|nr:bifunctional adenosylcobinamide kinase/adenosylcobinamide-phosphate guanylyltransferase [Halobacillus sp. Marseille-P3879]
MDFVTGGAHNGKLAWALTHYGSEAKVLRKGNSLENLGNLVIVDQVEQIIGSPELDADQFFRELWQWEQSSPVYQLVLIGTDITGGVVPAEREMREWRDKIGFYYQQFTKEAESVYRIWYGIAQQLK